MDATDCGDVLARAIQSEQFGDPAASAWRVTYLFCKNADHSWRKVHFDHAAVNGLDVCRYLAAEQLTDSLGDKTLALVALPREVCWKDASSLPSLPFRVYKGGADVRARSVIAAMFAESCVAGASFYIPIDVSHSLGAPALLNFTFDPHLPFDANFDEVRRLKCEGLRYLLESVDGCERWRRHTAPQLWWVTFIRVDGPSPSIALRHYDYDAGLQGLSVFQCATHSLWTMSFKARPALEAEFARRFGLALLE